jgi:hypothetical protein
VFRIVSIERSTITANVLATAINRIAITATKCRRRRVVETSDRGIKTSGQIQEWAI